MDPSEKKKSTDLSDLQARLGLKPAAQQPPPPDPAAQADPSTVSSPRRSQIPAPTSQHPSVAAATTEEREDPPANEMVAARDPYEAASAAISARSDSGRDSGPHDAGPLLDVPAAKQSHRPLLFGLGATLAIGLFVGYLFGGISHARVLFNNTIRDADRIRQEIKKLAAVNADVSNALKASRSRSNGRPVLDDTLIADLKKARDKSGLVQPETAKRVQNTLFRTNYALMEDPLIDRLFQYYNNMLRLTSAIDLFVEHTESSRAAIQSFLAKGNTPNAKKYGVVLAEDKGTFYLGSLVEVGQPICGNRSSKTAAKPGNRKANCDLKSIKGFDVRSSARGSWEARSGKPQGKRGLSSVVIPIIPDTNWRSVVASQPGEFEYRRFLAYARQVGRLAALLAKDEPLVLKDLDKQAGRKKLLAL